MNIEKNYFSTEKHTIEVIVEKKLNRQTNVTYELLARLDYDLVDNGDEEERIISNILYQNIILKYTGELYYLPSLLKDIETIEQGFKFERIQLSDEEYTDLKSIVERLKEFIKANEQK